METFPILTLLTLVPLIGSAVLFVLGNRRGAVAGRVALGFSLVALLGIFSLWTRFEPGSGNLQFVERHAWIPSLHVNYFLGIDGLGLLMVLLTTIITPVAILASWNIRERSSFYFAFILMLETGLVGTFTAQNFFHWFLFWELSLIPAFFLIKLWGGLQRTAAATQFFVYTMVGSISMLVGFLALGLGAGALDFPELVQQARTGQLLGAVYAKIGWIGLRPHHLALMLFVGIFLGLAVKVPLVPLHTWSPMTYAEAPAGTVILLTGAMSKMGVYGFLRILLPIFPDQARQLSGLLLTLAVFTILYSAFAALAQKDIRRMLAYSSINHLGYCMLGAFAVAGFGDSGAQAQFEKAAALSGVLLQMFNHGIIASALFCFVSFLENRSGGLRNLEAFGGLRKTAPVFCGLMGIAIFASLGLPGLSGFVGEFLIFKGVFSLSAGAAMVSTIGLLVTSVFLLALLQRLFNGPLNPRWVGFADLTTFERAAVAPAMALIFLLGIYPQWVIGTVNASVMNLVNQMSF